MSGNGESEELRAQLRDCERGHEDWVKEATRMHETISALTQERDELKECIARAVDFAYECDTQDDCNRMLRALRVERADGDAIRATAVALRDKLSDQERLCDDWASQCDQLLASVDALTQERDDLAERAEQAWLTADAEQREALAQIAKLKSERRCEVCDGAGHKVVPGMSANGGTWDLICDACEAGRNLREVVDHWSGRVRELKRDLAEHKEALTRCQAHNTKLLERAREAEQEAKELTLGALAGIVRQLPEARGSTAWRLERLRAAVPRALGYHKQLGAVDTDKLLSVNEKLYGEVDRLAGELTAAEKALRQLRADSKPRCIHDDCDGQALPGADECWRCFGSEVVDGPGPPAPWATWDEFAAAVEADPWRPEHILPADAVAEAKRQMARHKAGFAFIEMVGQAGEDPVGMLAVTTGIDPMHPTGRCECGGEGECEWCEQAAESEGESE